MENLHQYLELNIMYLIYSSSVSNTSVRRSSIYKSKPSPPAEYQICCEWESTDLSQPYNLGVNGVNGINDIDEVAGSSINTVYRLESVDHDLKRES